MKAVVWHGIGDIRMEDVAEPRIQEPSDAIVRLTSSAICGTDLHMIRGTMPGMKEGTILGHEGVGVVEELGDQVRNFNKGDRVVICSTISCGSCSYCRAGYTSQCDNANPNGPTTAFFGGPEESGSFNGMQAEKVRVPYAANTMVPLPDSVSDEQAILISDIFPTGYFGAELAEIKEGDTVAVFGCGPVGQFAIASAKLKGAGRIIAIDRIEDRLAMARDQNAEVINFEKEDPIKVIKELTGGIGVDRIIDAVGVDAEHADHGPAKPDEEELKKLEQDVQQAAPEQHPDGKLWQPGNAPMQVWEWAVQAVAKAGTIGVIGVYSQESASFPIGDAMNKNLTIKMGNCPHRRYVPMLVDLVARGTVDPLQILTKREPLTGAIEAYEHFDQREPGWVKVELKAA